MESLVRDLREAVRSLLRSPATAGLVVLTLALGIGANTAIFSVVNGVLLEPLPYPHPEQLVRVIDSAPKIGFPRFGASPPNYRDWRDQNRSFATLDAIHVRRYTLTEPGVAPQVVVGAAVSGTFFDTIGLRPLAGRFLVPEDSPRGGERLAVVGEDLWRQRFGGDPKIVSRRITLGGNAYTVVGVAPRALTTPARAQIWEPLLLDADQPRGGHYLQVLGRLRPGVSLASAQADLSAIAGRLQKQYPDTNTNWGVLLLGMHDLLVEDIRPALAVLQWAVWVVLLIACANVANLLLARMASREREMAVRAALGAGRWRITRQVTVESVVLFGAGGVAGLLLAFALLRVLVRLNPDAIPRADHVGIDGRVLAYTLLVSVGLGVLVGLLPALAAAGGGRLYSALKEGGRAVAGGRRGRLLRQGLVLAETALALVLLIGAGLLLQSFARLQAVDPGFRPEGLLTARLALPTTRYTSNARQAAFFEAALERVRALPAVTGAATVMPLPLGGGQFVLEFLVAGRPAPPPGQAQNANVKIVSADYFRTMQIPSLKGRLFSAADNATGARVAVINRAMAAKFWPDRDPIGQRITFGDPGKPDVQWLTVVGVVGDVHGAALNQEADADCYWPQAQEPAEATALVVRTTGDPRRLIEPIRRAIQGLDPDLPLDRVDTMEAVVATSLAQNRVKTALLGTFAALALLLAAIGVYGLVSYAVGQRTHEIGIRLALGSQPAGILRLIVGQGMGLVALGVLLGVAGAWASTRVLAGQLYQVSVTDPLTYAGVPLLLLAVALVANWLPARRAARVDPLEALRYE